MDNEDRLNLLNVQTGAKGIMDAHNAKRQQQKLDAILDELKRQRMGPKCPACKGPLEKEHQGRKCMHCGEELCWVHGVPCVPADEQRLLAEFKQIEEEKLAKEQAEKEKRAREEEKLLAKNREITERNALELANQPFCFGCGCQGGRGTWRILDSEEYSSYKDATTGRHSHDSTTVRGSVNYCTKCYNKAYPSWFVFSSLALSFGVLLALLGYAVDAAF